MFVHHALAARHGSIRYWAGCACRQHRQHVFGPDGIYWLALHVRFAMMTFVLIFVSQVTVMARFLPKGSKVAAMRGTS